MHVHHTSEIIALSPHTHSRPKNIPRQGFILSVSALSPVAVSSITGLISRANDVNIDMLIKSSGAYLPANHHHGFGGQSNKIASLSLHY